MKSAAEFHSLYMHERLMAMCFEARTHLEVALRFVVSFGMPVRVVNVSSGGRLYLDERDTTHRHWEQRVQVYDALVGYWRTVHAQWWQIRPTATTLCMEWTG